MIEIFEELQKDGVIFRAKTLNELGVSNYLITKMVNEGHLKKIYQGVYAIDDIKNIKLTDINVIIENGVLSLMSAAVYYELIDGTTIKCDITLDRDQKPPKIPYDIFMYYYTTSDLYGVGLNVINQGNRKLKIYDLERTMCDIIKHRNKYDEQLVNTIFSNYLKRNDANIPKLLSYSKKVRIYNVILQYLEMFGGYGE